MDKNWYKIVYNELPPRQKVEVGKVAHEFRSQIPRLTRDGAIELTMKLWDLMEKEEWDKQKN
jgi:hypothetical protein